MLWTAAPISLDTAQSPAAHTRSKGKDRASRVKNGRQELTSREADRLPNRLRQQLSQQALQNSRKL